MSNPTIFEDLRHLQAVLLTRMAELQSYAQSWGSEFSFKYIQEIPKAYQSFRFDPNQLTLDEMTSLGFRRWDESGLQLIPLWLFPYIKPGSVITDIFGDTSTFSGREDKDNRFGLLSFGVVPKVSKSAESSDPVSCLKSEYDRAAESL